MSGAPLAEPVVRVGREGVLDVALTAAAGVTLAGHDSAALGFNGTSPGPTLRVQPGDLLRVRVINHLDAPTNLHTHGLHVSPQGNGDNPFVSIAPGSAFDYSFRIPADHPPGTYWYHPHRHGTVADQLFGGLAGALLIGPHPDPALPVTTERMLLITDTTLDTAERVVAVTAMEKMMGPPVPPARLALPSARRQYRHLARREPLGRRSRPCSRLDPAAHPLHQLPRPQRLPLPHSRS